MGVPGGNMGYKKVDFFKFDYKIPRATPGPSAIVKYIIVEQGKHISDSWKTLIKSKYYEYFQTNLKTVSMRKSLIIS